MTDIRDVFGKIGSQGGPPGLVESIFRARVKGEIPKEDYDIQNAVWVSNHLDKYPCKPYPSAPESVRQYLTKRLRQGLSRDVTLHRNLSIWAYAIQRIMDQNHADESLLRWSKEKCVSVALAENVSRIDQALIAFENSSIPSELLADAAEVQKRDMEIKVEEERRR